MRNPLDILKRAVSWLERRCEKREAELGVWGAGLFFSCVIFCVACLAVAPEFKAKNFGVSYAQLSQNPFDMQAHNDLRERWLTPFLGWLIHLRGDNFILLPLMIGVVLMTVVYAWARRKDLSPVESLGVAAMIGLSSPLLSLLQYPGYGDTTTYLLLFLALAGAAEWRPGLWAIPFCLALLNHESALFMLPAIWLLALRRNARFASVLKTAALTLIAVAPMAVYHAWLQRRGVMPLSEGHYLSLRHITDNVDLIRPIFAFGVFQGFRLFWFFPLAALLYCGMNKKRFEFWLLASIIAGMLAQLLVAYDVSRLAGLAFPSVILGAVICKEYLGDRLKLWMYGLILCNFFIQPWYVGGLGTHPLNSTINVIVGRFLHLISVP